MQSLSKSALPPELLALLPLRSRSDFGVVLETRGMLSNKKSLLHFLGWFSHFAFFSLHCSPYTNWFWLGLGPWPAPCATAVWWGHDPISESRRQLPHPNTQGHFSFALHFSSSFFILHRGQGGKHSDKGMKEALSHPTGCLLAGRRLEPLLVLCEISLPGVFSG